MDTVAVFEDLLELFAKHSARYLIIGGFAFAYHARPRYTKGIDIWVGDDEDNVQRVNAALSEFGSPQLLDVNSPGEIVQIGVPPNRIDVLREVQGASFSDAWPKRNEDDYGRAKVHWVDIDTLIEIKSRIDDPRHQEDARILRKAKSIREQD